MSNKCSIPYLTKGAVMFSLEIVVGMLVRVAGQGRRVFTYTGSSYKDGELVVRYKDGSMLSVKPADLRSL